MFIWFYTKIAVSKQWRSWSDAALCGVWSGSELFVYVPLLGFPPQQWINLSTETDEWISKIFYLQLMSLLICFNSTVPACCFFLRLTAALITDNSSSSSIPLRRESLRETSELPNKHTYGRYTCIVNLFILDRLISVTFEKK